MPKIRSKSPKGSKSPKYERPSAMPPFPLHLERPALLFSLLDLLRDRLVMAAAAGIAWWGWENYRDRQGRHDDAARTLLIAERQAADLELWTGLIDRRTAAMAGRLDEIAAAGRLAETRAAAKVRVHRLLQSTTDPFLTFAEIERALGQVGRLAGVLPDTATEAGETAEPLAGDHLRRLLIDLVSDGVVAQLDRDRYFIASDFEASDLEASDPEGEDETPGGASA